MWQATPIFTHVADYLNTTKESLLMKMAWEMMNPEYKKVMQRKPTAVKKKYPISKTAAPPTKFLVSSCVQRLSAYINLDVLDKLFDDENSPKMTKLENQLLLVTK
uniref:Brf1 TBP-binding domain-containing protein n=1 Tax=Brassica oleracea var. oleracea TaxID=109376 RepID=A0A0D3BIC4_BRAOL